jgi:hypothetical protein
MTPAVTSDLRSDDIRGRAVEIWLWKKGWKSTTIFQTDKQWDVYI